MNAFAADRRGLGYGAEVLRLRSSACYWRQRTTGPTRRLRVNLKSPTVAHTETRHFQVGVRHRNRHYPGNLMTSLIFTRRFLVKCSNAHHCSSFACAATGIVSSSWWRAGRLHAGQPQVVTQPPPSVCNVGRQAAFAWRADSRLHTTAVARADAAWGGCAWLGLQLNSDAPRHRTHHYSRGGLHCRHPQQDSLRRSMRPPLRTRCRLCRRCRQQATALR